MSAIMLGLLFLGALGWWIYTKVQRAEEASPVPESNMPKSRCRSSDYMDMAKTVQVFCELDEGHEGYHRTHIDWSVGQIVTR